MDRKFRVPGICKRGHKGFWIVEMSGLGEVKVLKTAKETSRYCTCVKDPFDRNWAALGDLEMWTGLTDKQGLDIYENDIYIGYLGLTTGSISKNRPREIPVFCKVVWISNEAKFHGRMLKPMPRFQEAYETNRYRDILYDLHALPENGFYTGPPEIKGDGKTCHFITVQGNVFEHMEERFEWLKL